MVETLNKIGNEELDTFSAQLLENKNNPEIALQLFKVLARYELTGDQLQ